MINTSLLWLFLFPVFLTFAGIFIIPKITGNPDRLVALSLGAIGLLISVIILTGAFYAGKGIKTSDTEIWNGQITSKARVHGSYVRSYSCHCHNVSSGSGKNQSSHEECDTCYEDHFTVKWGCASNVGDFTIDSADLTSRAVYLLPDPNRYTTIKVGDPASTSHFYTNYIKAVPESLFRPLEGSLKTQFAGMIPAYPGNVYDFYKVDRVLPVGVSIPNLQEWNDKLSVVLKTLGPAKQANVVIVVVKSNDPNYFYALQDAWLNGKKNDIVVTIGAPDFPKKAAWVNVMALAQDAIFQVKMRDDILALDDLTADSVITAIGKETSATFKRKRMRDFEYLDAEIDPPTWIMIVAMIVVFLLYAGGLFAVYKNYVPRRFRY